MLLGMGVWSLLGGWEEVVGLDVEQATGRVGRERMRTLFSSCVLLLS